MMMMMTLQKFLLRCWSMVGLAPRGRPRSGSLLLSVIQGGPSSQPEPGRNAGISPFDTRPDVGKP